MDVLAGIFEMLARTSNSTNYRLRNDAGIRQDDPFIEELGNRERDQPGNRTWTVGAMVVFFIIVPNATRGEVGDRNTRLERRATFFHLYFIAANLELGV